MGAFLLGLIIGAAGAFVLFTVDEGEVFLKIAERIKQTADKYKQSS